MKIPFISSEVFEGNYPINLYFNPQGYNGRPALIGTPGLTEFCDLGTNAEIRGVQGFSDVVYAVSFNKVYKCELDGTVTALTGTIATASGKVWMASGHNHVVIVDGAGNGYYILSDVLSAITDPDFPNPNSLTYQDGYFIVTTERYFFISAIDDPTDWDALDFASAEALPDDIVVAVSDHRELFLFGESSIEVFYNSGDPTFPFTRLSGVFIEYGIGAARSIAKLDNTLFWLSSDFVVRKLSPNYGTEVVSPPALNKIISDYSSKTDAFAFSWAVDGNYFYTLTFPIENVTWLYNAATQNWCQWAGGAAQDRHRSNCGLFYKSLNKTLVGDRLNGKIYEIDPSTYTDDGSVIHRTRQGPPLFGENREKIFYHMFELEFKAGVGLNMGQGSDPQAMLQWSNDGGRNWSNEHWRDIGKIGETTARISWRNCGLSRSRIFKVDISDPIETIIIDAHIETTTGFR